VLFVGWGHVLARLIDLWDAGRKRGAEPLFSPSINAAIRARRPVIWDLLARGDTRADCKNELQNRCSIDHGDLFHPGHR
jgi:hypothetical protein